MYCKIFLNTRQRLRRRAKSSNLNFLKTNNNKKKVDNKNSAAAEHIRSKDAAEELIPLADKNRDEAADLEKGGGGGKNKHNRESAGTQTSPKGKIGVDTKVSNFLM